jgi:hypothetical protein
MEYIITFPKTHTMIKSEKILSEEGILVGPMPLPPELGDGCGFCLRIKDDYIERAIQVLSEKKIKIGSVYKVTGDKKDRRYTPLY